MTIYKKILVICPSNMTTGGPEALHQLVSHMRDMRLPAYIVYTPFGSNAKTPLSYQKYNIEVTDYEDAEGNFIIFPEIYPMQALQVKYAKPAIWWLSLDNFLERKNTSFIRDSYHYVRAIIRRKRPVLGARALRHLIHFAQTEHARIYLNSCGITPIPLIDSINEIFLDNSYKQYLSQKKNVILYNPTKGKKITESLIKRFSQFEFVPLRGYTPEAMRQLFFSAKLYIEFGQHPGRDRMPREAAMHGCCIITHRLGSASNEIDVPIPARYKINSSHPDFITDFEQLTHDIFTNFEEHCQAFEPYRNYVMNESKIFKQQISDYFACRVNNAP